MLLEVLDRTAVPARRQGGRQRVWEDLLLASLDAVEDGARDRSRIGLRYLEVADHVGVHRTGKDGVHPNTPTGEQRSQRLRQRERRCLGGRVRRVDRQGGECRHRQYVDYCAPRTSQLRQERLRHAVRSEEVDRQVLLEYRAIAEIVQQGYAGIVDQDIE